MSALKGEKKVRARRDAKPDPDRIAKYAISHEKLDRAIDLARKNWEDWRVEFEFGLSGEPPHKSPLLADAYRFLCFAWEYSVFRDDSHQDIEKIRRTLVDRPEFLAAAVAGPQEVEDLATRIRTEAETTIDDDARSAISKIIAFAKPDKFIAYDTSARKGAYYIARDVIHTGPYATSYVAYYEDVMPIFKGGLGNQIRANLSKEGRAFHLRVLDCCLMIEGGRGALLRGLPTD